MGGGEGYKAVAYFVNWVIPNPMLLPFLTNPRLTLLKGDIRPQPQPPRPARLEIDTHPLRLCQRAAGHGRSVRPSSQNPHPSETNLISIIQLPYRYLVRPRETLCKRLVWLSMLLLRSISNQLLDGMTRARTSTAASSSCSC